jgi:hypothetical protein
MQYVLMGICQCDLYATGLYVDSSGVVELRANVVAIRYLKGVLQFKNRDESIDAKTQEIFSLICWQCCQQINLTGHKSCGLVPVCFPHTNSEL